MDFTNETIDSIINGKNERYVELSREYLETHKSKHEERFLLTIYDKTTQYNLTGIIGIDTTTNLVVHSKQFRKE